MRHTFSKATGVVLWIALLAPFPCRPQQDPAPAGQQQQQEAEAAPSKAEEDIARRAALNLLAVVDTASGESRRNENVQFNLIDNNALKELNVRLGTTATIVDVFQPDRDYYSTEYGNQPEPPPHISSSPASAIHGSLWETHGNSVFNARSFFQVGAVRPAHENDYGFTFGSPAWRGAAVFFEGGQQRIRGNVNGNVLVPRADERTPLTNDQVLRSIVQGFLSGYPAEPPNRTDINERALNTNSLQAIDDDRATARLEQQLPGGDRLMLAYSYTSQQVTAFQLVAGQNPDTTTRAHTARLTWNRAWNAGSFSNITASFDRVGSLLALPNNYRGPAISLGEILERLGGNSSVPLNRAQNLFRYAGEFRQLRGRHLWSAGAEMGRRQVNGSEISSHRGTIHFRYDFGRDAITNLRMGVPGRFSGAVGESHRGFRVWEPVLFAGDEVRVRPDLTLHFGLRFEPVGRPMEVNALNQVPYDGDRNNLAPRFGFAWRLPGSWGVMRGAYGIHYGQIYPVTFQQVRFNPPGTVKFEVQVPNLVEALQTIAAGSLDPNARSTLIDLSPDLASPYSHQYNFSWEPLNLRQWKLQLGYVGSRTHKLIMMWFTNRAARLPGIPQTTATINERRSNPKHFDVRRVLNGSRAYFDAARVSVLMPRWRGLSLEAAYWFSKSIDLGAAYENTATSIEGRQGESQTEFSVHDDLKGLSRFDQPHSVLVRGNYTSPELAASSGWVRAVFGRWELAGVLLAKSGTPFGVTAGSDAPGYGNVDGDSGDRPHLLDPGLLGRTIGHPDTSVARLPRSAFAFIGPDEDRGNLGVNTFRKGAIANVNASLQKTWAMSGEKRLQLRAESINFLNTPQFAEPGRELAGPSFGYITNTLNDGRAFRFTLRFLF